MATMLFDDMSNTIVSNSLASMLTTERKNDIAKIGKAWDYYYGDQEKYIKQYRGENDLDYNDKDKMKFNYTKTVVDEYVGGVFAKPVNVLIDDDAAQARWDSISDPMSFTKIIPFMTKVQRISEVSGTCVVMPRYDEEKKRVYFEDIRGEFVHFIPDPKNPREIGAAIISYIFDTGNPIPGDRFLRRIEIWDKEKWAIYLYHQGHQEKRLIAQGENPYGVIPTVRFMPEEDDNSFYGLTIINDVVKINEEYNNLWTALMRISVMQSFSILVVTSEGQIKLDIAPTRFIKFEQTEDASAEYITPQPKINDVKGVLGQLKAELGDVSRVPSDVLSHGTANDYQSGYALRVKRVPIEAVWEKRRLSFGPAYKQLVKMALLVDAVHKKEEPNVDLPIDVLFTSTVPGFNPTEQAVQDEFDLRYDLITPLDLMMRKYPELSRAEAEEKLLANKEFKKKYMEDQFTYNVNKNVEMENLLGGAEQSGQEYIPQ
jgi:hypothetical protein